MKFNIVGVFESYYFLSLTQFLIMLDSAERKAQTKLNNYFLALEIISVWTYTTRANYNKLTKKLTF